MFAQMGAGVTSTIQHIQTGEAPISISRQDSAEKGYEFSSVPVRQQINSRVIK